MEKSVFGFRDINTYLLSFIDIQDMINLNKTNKCIYNNISKSTQKKILEYKVIELLNIIKDKIIILDEYDTMINYIVSNNVMTNLGERWCQEYFFFEYKKEIEYKEININKKSLDELYEINNYFGELIDYYGKEIMDESVEMNEHLID